MIRSANFKSKTTDTFKPFEKDTLQTNALENALWELKTLKKQSNITLLIYFQISHYCKEVRDLVDLFPNIERVLIKRF